MTPVAVVAGGVGDTGPVCALRLAECGFDVAMIDACGARDDNVQRIARSGRRCAVLEADSADTESFTAAFGRVRSELGSPSVLVNCVALSFAAERERSAADDHLAAIRRSLRALFVCSRAGAGDMVRDRRGRIINVAVDAARPAALDDHGRHAVAATLDGLIGFTRSAALELTTFGITMNFVAPSAYGVPRPRGVGRTGNDGTEGYPHAAARLITYLISDQAGVPTGHGSYVGGQAEAPGRAERISRPRIV